MAMRKKERKFKYKKRTEEQVKKRATQQGGMRDGFIEDTFARFTPGKGQNRLRILPPTWDDPEHHGFDVYVHYSIGADNATYLCLDKMKEEFCPICEERQKAAAEGDEDYAKELSPTKRVLVWLIDRDNEKEGPMYWAMPWTLDRDVCKLSTDGSGEVFAVDDPDEGYDLEFEKEGEKERTKYVGTRIARRSTPLDNDEALEYVINNPLPSILKYYDAEHIQTTFSGHAHPEEKSKEKEVSQEKETGTSTAKEEAMEEAEPVTWEEVQQYSLEEVNSLLLEEGLSEKEVEDIAESERKDAICEIYGIKVPEKKEDWRARLKKVKDDKGV